MDDLLGVMYEGASVSADGGGRGARSAVAVGCAALEELDDEFWFLKEEFRDCAEVVLCAEGGGFVEEFFG